MKAFRALRIISSNYHITITTTSAAIRLRLFSSVNAAQDYEQTTPIDESDHQTVFDSSHFSIPIQTADAVNIRSAQPTWDDKYRNKVRVNIFGEDTKDLGKKDEEQKLMRDRVNAMLAKTLLDVAVSLEYYEDNDEV